MTVDDHSIPDNPDSEAQDGKMEYHIIHSNNSSAFSVLNGHTKLLHLLPVQI